MKHNKPVSIYAVGALVSGVVLRYIEWPDSLFACLSVVMAAEIISSMLRMCDRLLDPPPTIFLIFCHEKITSADFPTCLDSYYRPEQTYPPRFGGDFRKGGNRQ